MFFSNYLCYSVNQTKQPTSPVFSIPPTPSPSLYPVSTTKIPTPNPVDITRSPADGMRLSY